MNVKSEAMIGCGYRGQNILRNLHELRALAVEIASDRLEERELVAVAIGT